MSTKKKVSLDLTLLPSNKRSAEPLEERRVEKKQKQDVLIITAFQQQHLCFEEGEDAFALSKPVAGELGEELRSALPDEVREKWARDLRSYRNGTTVTKHIGPWGNDGILYKREFIISKKVFLMNGNLTAIHLTSKEDGREFVLIAAFFNGWIDSYALNAYNQYFTQ